jgi:hypothetical protein
MQQAQVDGDRRSATSAELAERNRGLLLVLDSGRIEEATPAAVRDELVSA